MSPTAPVRQEEIIQMFSTVLKTRASLQLHNIFRGVPVNFPALVTQIDHDSVVLKVHCLQSVVISVENRTYIKSEYLPVFIRALPKTITFSNQEVVLTHFSAAAQAFVERTHMRVQFVEPIHVGFLSGDGLITGTLADISESSPGVIMLGAYISAQILVDPDVRSRIGLDFSLPGTDQKIHLVGTITSVDHKKGAAVTRIGIQTTPNPVTETALLKYIDRRQVEILDELQRIYERTCPSKRA